MSKTRFASLTALVFAAAFLRLIPHPWNWTPVAALSLFSGAQFEKRAWAFLVPLAAVFSSDLVLGFYPHMGFVYVGHISVVMVGVLLGQRRSVGRVAAASVAGSISFFLISNLSIYFTAGFYPQTMAGLMQCYTAAIPFFRNTLIGDLFFNAVLFGSFFLAERRIPALRPSLLGAH